MLVIPMLKHFSHSPNHQMTDFKQKNEELIENACETLPNLKPQLYDKKIWKTMTLHLGIKRVV